MHAAPVCTMVPCADLASCQHSAVVCALLCEQLLHAVHKAAHVRQVQLNVCLRSCTNMGHPKHKQIAVFDTSPGSSCRTPHRRCDHVQVLLCRNTQALLGGCEGEHMLRLELRRNQHIPAQLQRRSMLRAAAGSTKHPATAYSMTACRNSCKT
jgi:hypothetical protein